MQDPDPFANIIYIASSTPPFFFFLTVAVKLYFKNQIQMLVADLCSKGLVIPNSHSKNFNISMVCCMSCMKNHTI